MILWAEWSPLPAEAVPITWLSSFDTLTSQTPSLCPWYVFITEYAGAAWRKLDTNLLVDAMYDFLIFCEIWLAAEM